MRHETLNEMGLRNSKIVFF